MPDEMRFLLMHENKDVNLFGVSLYALYPQYNFDPLILSLVHKNDDDINLKISDALYFRTGIRYSISKLHQLKLTDLTAKKVHCPQQTGDYFSILSNHDTVTSHQCFF